jgi:alkyl sulfatase BDS1-like metallo-beta-lactamase superfamily hydrolase
MTVHARRAALLLGTAALCLAGAAVGQTPPPAGEPDGAAQPKPASEATRRVLRDRSAALPWDDREDFDLVQRGFVAGIPGSRIVAEDGRLIRNLDETALYGQSAPDTVNPSLWRNAQLLAPSGLYKVSDAVYQVRGVELANLTVVLGRTGYIVVDTLTTVESAKAAMALVRAHLGDRPVVGVIYTHSHIDHFGGAAGIISEAEARARGVPIVAPQGFSEEAISENVIAGPAMSRRAVYAFGHLLPLGPTGVVTAGIGPAFAREGLATGTVSLVRPTVEIARTGQMISIDGIDIEFQLALNTEAPAEMVLYFPQLRTLNMAEVANGTLHNVLTLRGAQVRDAKAWAGAITEALHRYGARTDTLVTAHFWPRWGQEKIVDYLAAQRDMYQYLHDQSVRLMNQGLTGPEIAERLTLPPALASRWFNQSYYGTLSHNAKAVYQRYLGWYDGNPATLDALPPRDSAARTVEAMGGGAAVLERGRQASAAGDYRWASELLSRLVFAEPENRAAQLALADSLEQQGYQATSSMWRNVFLSGASELRRGGARKSGFDSVASTIPGLPLGSILDLLAVRLVPERALAKPMAFDLVLDDGAEAERVEVRNGVLVHHPIAREEAKAAPLALARAQFVAAVTKRAPSAPAAIDARLADFLGLFEAPPGSFDLVMPSR